MIARRRTIAARYDELLAKHPTIRAPRPAPETVPVYYKYPVLLPLGTHRDNIRTELLERHGIETGALYSPPAHLMPIFRKRLGTEPGRLPAAEAMLGRQLTLPIHAAMEVSDADRVIAALGEVLGAKG
jgi:dTDP-4-amino-4,6-dideoxygalactose transaminase